eukprot:GHRQ01024701.1.p2 GENE.GHRQ01024701.1~~GHRQ01024701.1.p2  ORF type:complete len:114 (-),score=16.18 GHRQ01024701.1:11-352(-)
MPRAAASVLTITTLPPAAPAAASANAASAASRSSFGTFLWYSTFATPCSSSIAASCKRHDQAVQGASHFRCHLRAQSHTYVCTTVAATDLKWHCVRAGPIRWLNSVWIQRKHQ